MSDGEFSTLVARLRRAALAGGDLSAASPADTARLLGVQALTLSLRSARGSLELLWYDSADTLGTALDDLQFTLGEGPVWDALRTGRTVTVPDLREVPAARWPVLVPAAGRLAARSVIAAPLCLGVVTVGVLTGYRAAAGPFPAGQVDRFDLFSHVALDLLLHTPLASLATGNPPVAGLDLHRAEVHQAAGVLSVRLDLPVDQALLRLRTHAWRHDRPLLEVARAIVAGRLRFPE
ncbi:GAF and ANTAR domain-containing protein [Streptomyces sp. CRN 30]|uniref:GAF and ANTAR domain-containing protein n=1 Tax=Streptomyces sp. CRN 30 TaxID=3075613 RepID=UPI002A809A3C|nr:GAF and ANTAR domain-containing protein [Streptomyces sp. CRN 30]